MEPITLEAVLDFGNQLLASANVIIGFSLFVYILTHNLKSAVAHAFCALVAFVTLTNVVDITMDGVETQQAAYLWLRVQWAGIILVPAAYLHFSDALLRTTRRASPWRLVAVAGTYSVSAAAVLLAATTELVFSGVDVTHGIYHLVPGPLFGLLAIYYALVSLGGWINISLARDACLTSTSRRRMAYLMIAFLAPSVGVLPYLLLPLVVSAIPLTLFSVATLVGNVGIGVMTVIIAYIVAYEGVLLPDRVVKHQLLHFLMRGPLVAIVVVVIMLSIPHVPAIMGLPRDTIMVVAVAASVVTLQVFINLGKPALDRVIYRKDRQEINWLQSLDQRLLTSTDLQQLLENTLVALCELLRSPSGFVVTVQKSDLAIQVFSGSHAAADLFLQQSSMPVLIAQLEASRQEQSLDNDDFVGADSHWLLPLRSRVDQSITGVLGMRSMSSEIRYGREDLDAAHGLVRRAEMALEDMRLQQQVFALVQTLDDELDQIQSWRSSPFSVSQATLASLETSPVHAPGFTPVVKDALTQFWGGPKLTQSALRDMHAVQRAMPEHDNVPAKAVRAVLQEAIERLKPEGPRSMTSAEWLIYNILDLRFVQGHKIRDVVRRLAVSESDFYRKQRVAIEQIAETLTQMEADAQKVD